MDTWKDKFVKLVNKINKKRVYDRKYNATATESQSEIEKFIN